MKQGNSLEQKQSLQQTLTLTPQQMLVVKLIEMPVLELEERVKTEVQDNPALDGYSPDSENEHNNEQSQDEDSDYDSGEQMSSEEIDLGDYRTEDDIPDYKLRANNGGSITRPEDIPFSDTVSFYENLNSQLDEVHEDEQIIKIARYIVGSLDDDGFLRKDIQTILDELEIYGGFVTNIDEVKKALAVVRELEPAGIGASSLQECLLLQIDRRKDDRLHDLKHTIIEKYFDDFVNKRWDKLPPRFTESREDVTKALDEISRLNPRPGIALGESIDRTNNTIIPDFTVEADEAGNLTVTLNNYEIPDLRIERSFSEIIESLGSKKTQLTKDEKSALSYAKQKIDAAKGFIDAMTTRRNTLMSTMNAIVQLQHDFFVEGDELQLRPMILKNVADLAGLDISTVSRVCNSKYVQTNYSVYSLKFFFSDGFVTEDGEELSSREIRHALKECIDNEDKSKPLTDAALVAVMKEKGYPIARRTIAKYREKMGIPESRLRKEV